MNQKRTWSYDQTATSSSTPPKRQKTFQYDSSDTLPQNRYTIAWICALHIEMAAARAMLDDIHPDLPQDENDKNAYMLGSIGSHNIVIACLPNGHYGTNNAASVSTHLLRSFPSICKGFMVGIGGGVPSRADIRLGDVVVGTRVMQYDLGKIIDGNIQRTAVAKIPSYSLQTAVSNLRAKHELEPGRVPTILQDVAARYPEYGHPTSPDRLFPASYKHEPQFPSCSSCDKSKLLSSSTRMSNHPKIHYGAIASGNQVMKDSFTRDEIGRDLDIICFEMEAAGLMDTLPCLPIRGICDYADSHKSKEWQRYAAATAAACAKELIERLPASDRVFDSSCLPNSPPQGASPDRRQLLLESLRFQQIDSRKADIEAAHHRTCRWFLEHPKYLEWLDPQKQAQHHGFLWIRGKAGAGKSTIMKFIYLETKRKMRHGRTMTASFFFHARGDHLQRSIPGMYRSLLVQLLEGYTDLQDVLDDTDLVPRGQNGCPTLNVLKDIFRAAVSRLGQRSFTCFVDALDECDEQQATEMVSYFKNLTEYCADKGVRLQICFSSRPYPYIRIQDSIELTLEDQPGHCEDMNHYMRSNLWVGDSELAESLREKMLKKASGVFLWVVLVVKILNKEHQRGGMDLEMRLTEIPKGLSDLFRDILTRDDDNMENLLLCILWILCAKRPLRPEEYYHAHWSGLVLKSLVGAHPPKVPDDPWSGLNDCIRSCVITSSKGLAEITKTKTPIVQFIHESVRDFLVKDGGLQQLWPDLEFNWQASGHERLKQCCSAYINHERVRAFTDILGSGARFDHLSDQYPFLEYASQYVLYHSDAAAQAIPQAGFLSQTSTPDWVTTVNLFEKFKKRRYSSKASLIYILADKGFSALIRTWLQDNPSIDTRGERYERPLFAAMANGYKDAVAALLNSTSSICEGVGSVEGFGSKTRFVNYVGRTSLTWAAQEGLTSVVELLVRKGHGVGGIDLQDYTPLMRASEAGHQAVVSFLIKERAAFGSRYAHRATSLALKNGHASILKLFTNANVDWDFDPETLRMGLIEASKRNDEGMVKFLIDEGIELDAQDSWGHTALSLASENGHTPTLKLLIEAYADWDVNSKHLQEAFRTSAAKGNDEIAKLLIEKGVQVDARDFRGNTALSFALENGHAPTLKLLIETYADLDLDSKYIQATLRTLATRGNDEMVKVCVEKRVEIDGQSFEGYTALSLASKNCHLSTVKLLMKNSGQIEPDLRGETPRPALVEASKCGHEAIVKFLLDSGAEPNARDCEGHTAISEALSWGHLAIAKLLIDSGAQIGHNEKGSNPKSALIEATENNRVEFVRLLLELGANIETRGEYGRTPLIGAAGNGHVEVARLLLERKANIEARNEYGRTPLIAASVCGHETLAVLLIKHGANTNAQDKHGKSPLHCIMESCALSVDGRLCASFAELLLRNGAALDARDFSGETPLLNACRYRQKLAQRLLIEQGADVNARDRDGSTPLIWACESGESTGEPLLLIEKGADVNAKTEQGKTPLHMVCEFLWEGDEELARALIDNGADLHARDSEGSTPLHLAVITGGTSLVKLLIENGANVDDRNHRGDTPESFGARIGLRADHPVMLALRGL